MLVLILLHVLLLAQQTLSAAPNPHCRPDYELVATAQNITINCQERYSVIFNGTTPGLPLYMRENYTTWVRVYNRIQDQNLTVVRCKDGRWVHVVKPDRLVSIGMA
jgi:hypothetical protein